MPSSSWAIGGSSKVSANPFSSDWLRGSGEGQRPRGGASYVSGATGDALKFMTVPQLLDRAVLRHGGRDAAVFAATGERLSWHDLKRRADEVAAGLLALGIGCGDRVGIWAPNCVEWILTQFGTSRIGAILVNINPAYKAAELAHALNQSGTRVLLLARSFRGTDYGSLLEEVRARCPGLEQSLVFEESWESLLGEGDAVSEAQLGDCEAGLQFDDAINIQYTSGTTGLPKGATLSHHNVLNNGYFIGAALRYSQRDRVCIPVPFYHCFGMVLGNLACTTHGACMVVPGESYDPVAVLETVQAERCTSLYGVPTMFIAELDHPRFAEFDLSSLRTGIMAGSPCPIEVMKKVQSLMHMDEVTICYGMTETSPVSTQSRIDDPLDRRVSTVGRVHPHVELKIVEPASGAIVARGTPGELCTRAYSVMLGYWNDPSATQAAIDEARWMHTGDLATMDDEGYLKIVGRIKDMIIRGGENVYPREVEEFLYTHPDVSDVQVIGVPSEKYGEEVMAWVKAKEGRIVTGEQLAEYCRGQIATYKIPRYWRLTDAFPMTVTGKIQKFRMREISVQELGLERAARTETA
jgi:fatty-acyl-CoA synthase